MTEQPWYESADPIWTKKPIVEYDRKKLYRELKRRGMSLREAAIEASDGDALFYTFNYRKCQINAKLVMRLQILYGIDPLSYVIGDDRELFRDTKKKTLSPKITRIDHGIQVAPKKVQPAKYNQKTRHKWIKADPADHLTPAQIRSGSQYREKCRKCVYRCGSGSNGCDYLLIVGHSRGCPPDDCKVYKTGQQLKQRQNPLSQL